MKRMGTVKFPNSVQLFKFCQKMLSKQRGEKVKDQDVGAILDFNPSDCSHWKRGEKSVRSVFVLAKLAETLQVEVSLLHDVASGLAGVEEACYEQMESVAFADVFSKLADVPSDRIAATREKILNFVSQIHTQCEFNTPPLYLPEVLSFFSFVTTQPVDMLEKLSRILRVKPGHYCIQYQKGDLKAQTRMSMVRDLARIVLIGERERFPELGALDKQTIALEEILFTANLLIPKNMLVDEMSKLDVRKNMISELSSLLWVPKTLLGFQIQDMIRTNSAGVRKVTTSEVSMSDMSSASFSTENHY